MTWAVASDTCREASSRCTRSQASGVQDVSRRHGEVSPPIWRGPDQFGHGVERLRGIQAVQAVEDEERA